MIPGRPLAAKEIDKAEERARIVRESDYNLDGKPPAITPNEYWSMAKEFDPKRYDADKWMKAAKDAGFKYAVFTAKHHEGFAMWPSAFGDFGTRSYIGGRDLVKPFVEACRKHGLKVGLYFSPPDWYFDREYMSFLYGGARRRNSWLPSLGPDLKPRTGTKSSEETQKHHAAYAALVKGQVEELLTRYGTIDVIWFDGRPGIPHAEEIVTAARLRELQPGIVINPRLHGGGDYVTFERRLPEPLPAFDWAEFCNTWTTSWSHQELPFRAPAFVLGQLARSRSLGMNYLLGVGPMASGEMSEGVYQNMAVVADWMKTHAGSVHGVKPLPAGETASVPATSREAARYLFAIPRFDDKVPYPGNQMPEAQLPSQDETLTLRGVAPPKSVTLMATGKPLEFKHEGDTLTVNVPASVQSNLVSVAVVSLP